MGVIHGASKSAHLRTNGIHEFAVAFRISLAVYAIISFFKNRTIGSCKSSFECFGNIISNLIVAVPIETFEVNWIEVVVWINDVSDLSFIIEANNRW